MHKSRIHGVASLLVLGVLGLFALVAASIFISSSKTSVDQSQAATQEKTFTLSPSEDTYVSSGNTATNYGSSKTLSSGDRSKFISYLKVDLSSLAGRKITSAKLRLRVTDTSTSNQDILVVANNNWREGTMTYRTRPTLGQKVLSFTPSANNTWTTVDLSQFIPAATSGQVKVATFAITSSGADAFAFSSKEGENKPSIDFTEIVTVFPTSTPGSNPGMTTPPTAAPTAMPTNMPGMTTPPVVTIGGNAMAYGIWNPSDAKYASAGPQKYPTCTQEFHDSFFVIGPDGKKYPTWHPAVATAPNGVKCTFGHEHGRDPSKSLMWNQVQQYFYFDANKNGTMDSEEQRVTGVPFGYANEQLDSYAAAKNLGYMRHEDHVGHKIEWINGEVDSSGEFGNNPTGGVVIPIRTESTPKWRDSGAKCMYFSAIHQGVNSPDALTNNLHAVSFFADCKGPNSSYDMKAAVTNLVPFGASGEFTNLCDPVGDRETPIVLGKSDANKNYPGTRSDGFRDIIQRSCLEKYFLVPEGQYSMNAYEAWAGSLKVVTNTNRTVLSGINITLDVEDAIRYYDPAKANKIGYYMDLCYEVLPNGNRQRGTCNATNYGAIKGITWNDTRSDYRGIHRGMYYQGPRLFNAGGPEVWYTDPFGGNAQTTPFPGSIRQVLSSKNVDYLSLGNIDPRNSDRAHDDGEGTVHAPN